SFSHFRCPYHHWTFALDGRILSMPQCEKDDSLSLEELPCEQALGFIWLNLDQNASPLKTYLSDILAPLENYRLAEQHCHSIWHSPLSANWKTSVDAHNEVYHLPALHPEILGIIDDKKAKTQCFSLHAKMTVPMFTSPQRPLGHRAKKYAQNVYKQMQLPYPIDRQRVTQVLQRQSALPLKEEELNQTQLIYIFPNVQLNLRHNEVMVFRHLPDPDHPQQCRFTQFLLRSVPAEQRPEEREISALDKRYGSITGVDLRIVSHVQKGLQNDPNGYIHLTKNEELIRHMHQTLSTMDLRDE
ncbi:MAG: SRPBCC family protein, partial [Myxococcota bacterium]|nr:SRPBCC family protein [Myxococcota bacterium]